MKGRLPCFVRGVLCGYLAGRGRGRGSRGGLLTLLAGAALFLLVLALTPHPDPSVPRRFLRRIHQQTADNTAPKQPHHPTAKDGKGADSHSPFLPQPQSGPSKSVGEAARESAAHVFAGWQKLHSLKNHTQAPSPPILDPLAVYSKLAQEVPRSHNARVQLAKAQETALNALQYGYRLTAVQRNLLNRLNPMAKKELEERVYKTRMLQDEVYLDRLRTKKQVIPQPGGGGGEIIISTPRQPVRWPLVLKKILPAKWPHQYHLYNNLTHYPWPNSAGCEGFNTTFRLPGTLPMRSLASFPSSGNTWVRYLIEGATGIFTGSMYDDSALTRKGLYGEGLLYNSGMTIVQKSHGYTTGEAMKLPRQERMAQNHLEELNHQGVIVIRNPFKALISHRHLDIGGHTGYAPKAQFVGEGWAEFVQLKAGLWRDFYVDWVSLSHPSDIHITHYEHLKDMPVEEMRKVLQYLHLMPDPLRLQCLGKNKDGLFKRKPARNVPLDFNPYTPRLKGIIYQAIRDVDEALKGSGKAGLPLEKYEIYDEAEAAVMAAHETHNPQSL